MIFGCAFLIITSIARVRSLVNILRGFCVDIVPSKAGNSQRLQTNDHLPHSAFALWSLAVYATHPLTTPPTFPQRLAPSSLAVHPTIHQPSTPPNASPPRDANLRALYLLPTTTSSNTASSGLLPQALSVPTPIPHPKSPPLSSHLSAEESAQLASAAAGDPPVYTGFSGHFNSKGSLADLFTTATSRGWCWR